MDAAFNRYRFARNQKIGRKIPCAYCGERFRKKTQAHAFCSNNGPNNCKDNFWAMKDEDGIAMRDVAHNANTNKASAVPREGSKMDFIVGTIAYASKTELNKIAQILGYEGENNGSSNESS